MRRRAGRHQQHPIQSALLVNRLCQMQVSVVDGIEAAAKQGNAAHFRSMTGFFGLRRYSTNRLPMTCTTSEPVCSASCSAASRAV